MSATLRKREPFCAFCRQAGRLEYAKLVDHKVPVADGGPMFDVANIHGLCRPCHGMKYEMEEYARKHGTIELLRTWCDEPDERPARFRPYRAK